MIIYISTSQPKMKIVTKLHNLLHDTLSEADSVRLISTNTQRTLLRGKRRLRDRKEKGGLISHRRLFHLHTTTETYFSCIRNTELH